MRTGGHNSSTALGRATLHVIHTLRLPHFSALQLREALGRELFPLRRVYDVLALLRVLGWVARAPSPLKVKKRIKKLAPWCWTDRALQPTSLHQLVAPKKPRGLEEIAYNVLHNVAGTYVDYNKNTLNSKNTSSRRIYTVICIAEGLRAIVRVRRQEDGLTIRVWDSYRYANTQVAVPLVMDDVAPATRTLPDAGLA